METDIVRLRHLKKGHIWDDTNINLVFCLEEHPSLRSRKGILNRTQSSELRKWTGVQGDWGSCKLRGRILKSMKLHRKETPNLYRSLSGGSGEHCHVHVKEKTLQGQRMNRRCELDYPQCTHRAGMHFSSNQKEQRAPEVYPGYSVDSPQLSNRVNLSLQQGVLQNCPLKLKTKQGTKELNWTAINCWLHLIPSKNRHSRT